MYRTSCPLVDYMKSDHEQSLFLSGNLSLTKIFLMFQFKVCSPVPLCPTAHLDPISQMCYLNIKSWAIKPWVLQSTLMTLAITNSQCIFRGSGVNFNCSQTSVQILIKQTGPD